MLRKGHVSTFDAYFRQLIKYNVDVGSEQGLRTRKWQAQSVCGIAQRGAQVRRQVRLGQARLRTVASCAVNLAPALAEHRSAARLAGDTATPQLAAFLQTLHYHGSFCQTDLHHKLNETEPNSYQIIRINQRLLLPQAYFPTQYKIKQFFKVIIIRP